MISRIKKLDDIKRKKSVDVFLITSSSSVKYFSGYFFYFEYGTSPFHLLPALLMVIPGVDSSLIIASNETPPADAEDSSINVIYYESYTWKEAPDPVGDSIKMICEYIEKNNLKSARFGIEARALPFVIYEAISSKYPDIRWVDTDTEVSSLKTIKDADEINFIRNAAALSDLAQTAVLRNAREGITELELFSIVHGVVESHVGHRVPLMADLSSGQNTNSGGGMPTNKLISSGDLILSDFQACLTGYWGDSCSTIVIGSPTSIQKKTFHLVREALEIGIQAVKPGVEARDVDRVMREHIGSYPHHSGHGVGTCYHEAPRITPYNSARLEPNMIVALEPAVYQKEFGIRLEHLLLVTESGCEVITKFTHQFEQ